jgi:formamidopyrimidine-DNA glycosylase
MAELPDLTVFARTLSHRFEGKLLKSMEIIVDKKLNVSGTELKKAVENKKLTGVDRVGKTLQFHFGNSGMLGLHLMLRGELKEIKADQELPKHTIAAFHFTGAEGFAIVDLLKQASLTMNPKENVVPDALLISEKELGVLLSKRSRKVKEVLMDQKAIRGIGNSYADEILWDARISPLSVAREIPEKVVKQLHVSMKKVLKEAISKIGAENKNELVGELRDFMNIHGAHIKKSPTGYPIKSEKINGRTAYFTTEQKKYG